MSRTKIVVTDYVEPDLEWERERLAGRDVDFEAYQLKFAPLPDLIEHVKNADMIIVNMALMPRQVIERLEKCRLILRHGVGYDNVDVVAATEKAIQVGYMADYCVEEVAEHAILLILACWRKILLCRRILEESSRTGMWDFKDAYPIFSLRGKTLGIIGCGRIGSRVLKKMAGFEINMLVCDPYLSESTQRSLGIKTMDLKTVLGDADIVTLHVPLNEETRHMIGQKELRMMKETAYLINTARAQIVDTQALTQALREGWIAGAGIDVYDKEPPPPNLELFRSEGATLTPHLAWYSEEAGWSIREKIMQDIERFLDGRPPRFLINKELLERMGEQRGAVEDGRLGAKERRSGVDRRSSEVADRRTGFLGRRASDRTR